MKKLYEILATLLHLCIQRSLLVAYIPSSDHVISWDVDELMIKDPITVSFST